MIIKIKQSIIEEGLMNAIKGAGLLGAAAGAGAMIHKDYSNASNTAGKDLSSGEYLGQKFGQMKNSLHDAKNNFSNGLKEFSKDFNKTPSIPEVPEIPSDTI